MLVASGYRPVGRDFPVFLHPETREEYALARTERKHGRGYRGFEFFVSPDVTLEEDLARRDLTINAMARDAEDALIDPFGGEADLRAGVLRHVSPAFVEDPLRVLRVARFAARFGFAVAPETGDADANAGRIRRARRARPGARVAGALAGADGAASVAHAGGAARLRGAGAVAARGRREATARGAARHRAGSRPARACGGRPRSRGGTRISAAGQVRGSRAGSWHRAIAARRPVDARAARHRRCPARGAGVAAVAGPGRMP